MGIELALLGVFVGILSGFFGIGGGTILVPALLLMGLDIKAAISISIVQMVFSSIYGSYLNQKKGTLDMTTVLYTGVGGFVGGLFSATIISTFSSTLLEAVFLGFVLFALARLMMTSVHVSVTPLRKVHPAVLFLIGLFLGAFATSIGVGGSILLVPILASFLHVPLKNAISAGLFFVVFSSISALISLSYSGMIDWEHGIMVGVGSLVGVYIGIWLKHLSSDRLSKTMLLIFYLQIALYLAYRLIKGA